MIVPMVKVYVAARHRDRERLLEAIRELGVIHLVPADPAQALADGPTAEAIQALQRAQQVLYGIDPQGDRPELPAVEAAREVLNVERHLVEHGNRLALLHHELEQLDLWGNVRLQQIEALRQAGIELGFYAVEAHTFSSVRADCVAEVGELPNGRIVVAVAVRDGSLELPEGAAALPLPPRDAPSIRAEAVQIDAALKAGHRRLAELAHLLPEMHAELARLEQQAEFIRAQRGGIASDRLFAVQGWLPAEQAATLPEALAQTNLPAAVHWMEPADDEQPPTLIRSPAWARPVEGLFGILGTVAGYREFDVSVPFLIALPIFTAILISDGGYGAVLLLGLTLGYRRAAAMLGKHFTQLLIIISIATLLWGGVCATFFGVTLYPPLIAIDLSESSRTFMMRLCFWMGAIHLSIAQLWPAVSLFPDLRFLNRVGWALFIWGMLGVVQMFVLRTPMGWETPWPYLLLSGAALAIVFSQPSRNVGKMLLLGVANFPLSMLSAFSDVISYVRLMAVGLASGVLAASFNNMAAESGSWPLAVLVLVFGHSLNLGLAMIAMFAHGVRLNMLEFCNNLGMQWTGYRYRPFSQRTNQEY
jgi:V/A-type H+/Na+-transporting ATPase subunit I